MNNNNIKGARLENTVKFVLEHNGYSITQHKVWQNGVDIEAQGIIAECLNWYGGYIHPNRFSSIVDNLTNSKHINCSKYLIIAGTHVSKQQRRVCTSMGIVIIELPSEEHMYKWHTLLLEELNLLPEGVITSLPLINTITTFIDSEGLLGKFVDCIEYFSRRQLSVFSTEQLLQDLSVERQSVTLNIEEGGYKW